MQLTKNFKLEEFYKSDTAKARKIDNTPTTEAIVNITRVVDNCMQKIRDYFGVPVIITSGYRCQRLNQAVGGAADSQHLTGQAVDFVIPGFTPAQIADWCRNNLVFDQLILEEGGWVHISFSATKNRREVLMFDGRNYSKI